jgi:hypothetical protein
LRYGIGLSRSACLQHWMVRDTIQLLGYLCHPHLKPCLHCQEQTRHILALRLQEETGVTLGRVEAP